jgi:uncharacterized protein (TIGR04206 family)
VIDAQTQAVLQEAVRRESRSLLIYVGDAYPWTATRGGTTLAALQGVVKAEASAVTALGRYLVRRGVALPPLASYPTNFTSYNFIALDHLLPRLIEAERSSITALQRDVAALTDPEAKAQAQKLLDVKRRHLTQLEGLATPRTEPAAT